MSNSIMSAQDVALSSTEHLFSWKWSLSDLDNVNKNGLKVFSCFSCGGGSSLGYKLAGFDVIGCCEIDPDMMAVYKQNNHPKYSFLMDIRDFAVLEDIPKELYDLDILDGSPPCSVFSMAGGRDDGWNKEKKFREGQKLQKLDDLFFEFIKVAKRLQPKVVIAENVKGLFLGDAKGYVNEIVKAFGDAGYSVQLFLFNAARMGVPQNRERVFFVAQRKDLQPVKLKMLFNEPVVPFGMVRSPKGKPVNENTVIGSLAKYIQPSDRSMSDVARRVKRKDAYFTTPINHDGEPVHTITTHDVMYRGCDKKLMTDEDVVNCQTFPQDYDFMDQKAFYVCGMSVPPVMMAQVASQVYEQIFKEKQAK